MSIETLDFTYTDAVNEHFQRRRDILARHPDVRRLIAKNPWTALWVVALGGAQFVVAAYIGHTPWWVLLIAAYIAVAVIALRTARPRASVEPVTAIIVFVYAEMHRDATLSHITHTSPGELGFDFYVKIFTFGLGPLIGLLTTLFPSMTDFVVSFLQPGARVGDDADARVTQFGNGGSDIFGRGIVDYHDLEVLIALFQNAA